ncbi:MAG: putative DNA-binding domain-containing protein [Steroidobacteraceae bacterium]|nr:putative DNA-binding domain-containing protein [Steroidobacteraceae bacterium]
MASLLELQRSFAAALRDPGATCSVSPPANLAIYRNNAEFAFRGALEISFPVLRRRVGDDYFRQLVAQYRQRFPSRSGDLHWAGRSFAEFLTRQLGDGDYAWLADLARLEWACEEAAIVADLPAAGPEVLAAFAPDELERVRFVLQPSLRLVSSPFPIFTVWTANQTENAPPVDQSKGGEMMLVRMRYDTVEVQPLAPDLFSYLYATADGATLGEAMTAAALDERRLSEVLGFLFGGGLVVSASVHGDGQRVGTSS